MKFYMLLLFAVYVIPIIYLFIYIVVCFHHFATNKIYIISKYYKPFNATNNFFLVLKYHWQ